MKSACQSKFIIILYGGIMLLYLMSADIKSENDESKHVVTCMIWHIHKREIESAFYIFMHHGSTLWMKLEEQNRDITKSMTKRKKVRFGTIFFKLKLFGDDFVYFADLDSLLAKRTVS